MTAASTDRIDWRSIVWVTAVTLALLLSLEWTSLDLALARLSWDAALKAFPLRDHLLTTRVAHDGLKLVSALAFVWIAVSAWKPFGPLQRLDRPRRLYLLGTVATSLLVVALLKRTSALHCPWGLAEFGGAHPYLRLFEPVPEGWARGACFPAGHALAGFAYVAGYFAWRGVDRRVARAWLGAALLAGALAGASQQLRGAHFLSHTLWTAWLCWAIAAGIAWLARRSLRPVNAGAPAPLQAPASSMRPPRP